MVPTYNLMLLRRQRNSGYPTENLGATEGIIANDYSKTKPAFQCKLLNSFLGHASNNKRRWQPKRRETKKGLGRRSAQRTMITSKRHIFLFFFWGGFDLIGITQSKDTKNYQEEIEGIHPRSWSRRCWQQIHGAAMMEPPQQYRIKQTRWQGHHKRYEIV